MTDKSIETGLQQRGLLRGMTYETALQRVANHLQHDENALSSKSVEIIFVYSQFKMFKVRVFAFFSVSSSLVTLTARLHPGYDDELCFGRGS